MKAQEHRALGDAATGGARVDLGGEGSEDGFWLTFGDVVALSGDFFVADGFPVSAPAGEDSRAEALASEGLFSLARAPGERGERPGTPTRSSVPST